jgi:hypothetical protein
MSKMKEWSEKVSSIEYGSNLQEPVTQEEAQANHDAWWSSLTDEQKQQLYDNQEKAFELTIEEINYEDK